MGASLLKWTLVGPAVLAAALLPPILIPDPVLWRAAAITGVCLVLWLTEAVPLYATTLVLIATTAAVLGPVKPTFELSEVLKWSANSVLVLFFGGFALSIAASRHGLDRWLAAAMVRASGGSARGMTLAVMLATAGLSMWMSNIAACAMMLVVLRPLLAAEPVGSPFRRGILLATAFGANFGGIATPLGTGPNLIAIASVAKYSLKVSFLEWMTFALPLSALMLALSFVLIRRFHPTGDYRPPMSNDRHVLGRHGWALLALLTAAVVLWLGEAVHGIKPELVAIALAALLFVTGMLRTEDLAKVEWDTLMLIAGGIVLGELMSRSGLAAAMAKSVDWNTLPPWGVQLAFVAACALLAAVASNTASATMLIQIALSIWPDPRLAILIALGASMGVPFVISTPPNAMVYNQGGLRNRDLVLPGMILMVVGCLLVALGGTFVLSWTVK